jgi:hypothetical protein
MSYPGKSEKFNPMCTFPSYFLFKNAADISIDLICFYRYPLWKLIEKNPELVNAQVHEWSNSKDVEDLLFKLLKPSETDFCI